MRKVFYVLSVFACVSSLAFADQAVAPAAKAPAAAAHVMASMPEKIETGKVQSVSVADAAKGVKSEIVLVDANGKTDTILIKGNTTLYGADAKAVMLEKITAGSMVSVMYKVSPEGVKEAKSIKVVS